MAITRTQLFSSGSIALTQDADVTVPPTGGVTITNGAGYRAIEIKLGLASVVKLAVGNTLSASSYFSNDSGATWNFINRIDWTSYGPGGLPAFNDPDGTPHPANEDPIFRVPLNGLAGTSAKLMYNSHGIVTSTGITVTGIK